MLSILHLSQSSGHTCMPALLAGDASDTPSTTARGREYCAACTGLPAGTGAAVSLDCSGGLSVELAAGADGRSWLGLLSFVAACSSWINFSIWFVTDLWSFVSSARPLMSQKALMSCFVIASTMGTSEFQT